MSASGCRKSRFTNTIICGCPLGIPTDWLFCVYDCRDDHWSSANSNVYRQSQADRNVRLFAAVRMKIFPLDIFVKKVYNLIM